MKPRSLSLVAVVSIVMLSILVVAPAIGDPGTTSPDAGPVTLAAAPIPSMTTTTTVFPATATTVAPATTTNAPATTTTTAPPVTTTTVAPTTTTNAPATITTTVAPVTATTTAPIQTTTTAAQRVAGYGPSAESQFVSLVNNLRASVGVPALAAVGELRSYARTWSQHMSESDIFEHSNLYGIPGPWQSVAENIAASTSVQNAFDGLVSSSGHYANMVNPYFTEIGSGVWTDADGKLWITHVFRG